MRREAACCSRPMASGVTLAPNSRASASRKNCSISACGRLPVRSSWTTLRAIEGSLMRVIKDMTRPFGQECRRTGFEVCQTESKWLANMFRHKFGIDDDEFDFVFGMKSCERYVVTIYIIRYCFCVRTADPPIAAIRGGKVAISFFGQDPGVEIRDFGHPFNVVGGVGGR